MRVLIISHYNPGVFEYGGLATFVRNLSEALKDMGHAVHYISVSPTLARSYSMVRLAPSGFDPRELDLRLHEVVRYCVDYDGMYDVIIANDYFSPCVVRESRLVAYIHTFAGSPWELLTISYANRVATSSKMFKSMIEPLVRYVRQITSPWTGKDAGKEVEVLYPPPPQPPKDVVKPREEIGQEPVLCYVGRMQAHKNFGMFRKLVEDLGAAGLVISHDTGNYVEECGKGKIYYNGNVLEEVKWGLMTQCDLGVVPSLFEPYGLVALEFVRAGVPVIVSRNCGVVEVLNPITFDPTKYDDLLKATKEALKRRDAYLLELASRPIMKKKWSNLADELIRT